MENSENTRRLYATVGWGLLLIWWGVSIAIGPITIGLSAIGTGIILLGVTAACWAAHIQVKRSTIALGLIALVWGALDATLRMDFWGSFAVMLMVIGAVMIVSLLPRLRTA